MARFRCLRAVGKKRSSTTEDRSARAAAPSMSSSRSRSKRLPTTPLIVALRKLAKDELPEAE